jgi:hypothetical protein
VIHRHRGYVEGREPLASMAYFCLTLFLTLGGGDRDSASKRYRVDVPVLGKLSELTSVRGDRHEARKAQARPSLPLSGAERAWVEATVKSLALRLGNTRAASSLPLLTMFDLPPLPEGAHPPRLRKATRNRTTGRP